MSPFLGSGRLPKGYIREDCCPFRSRRGFRLNLVRAGPFIRVCSSPPLSPHLAKQFLSPLQGRCVLSPGRFASFSQPFFSFSHLTPSLFPDLCPRRRESLIRLSERSFFLSQPLLGSSFLTSTPPLIPFKISVLLTHDSSPHFLTTLEGFSAQ